MPSRPATDPPIASIDGVDQSAEAAHPGEALHGADSPERSVSGTAPWRSGAEIDPRPPGQIVLHHGYTYCLSAADGSIGDAPDEGVFDYDARILSRYRIWLAGRRPVGSSLRPTDDAWEGVLRVPCEDGDPDGPALPQDVLELRCSRRVGLGMVERLRITNHSMIEREADLVIEVAADFRDVTDLRGTEPPPGVIRALWEGERRRLTVDYVAHLGQRAVRRSMRVRIEGGARHLDVAELPQAPDGPQQGVPVFRLVATGRLAPHASTELALAIDSCVDGRWRSPLEDDSRKLNPILFARQRAVATARAERPTIETPGSILGEVIERAADDLLALRNWDLERDDAGWILNAGVPKYLGFFGRDTLTAGIQSAMSSTEVLRGALERSAETQGRIHDDARDEQPGRIVHEMRRDPLADLGLRPHDRYYGSHSGPAAFVIALERYWRWTADEATTRRLLPTAVAAMDWAEGSGDSDDDGLIDYRQRSRDGLRNQGWKDSDEAIRWPDGRPVHGRIATIEEQAFRFQAARSMAALQRALGEQDGDRAAGAGERSAEACLRTAERIRRVVHERFWVEDDHSWAMALDEDGRQVRTVASNPLHLLASGMLDGPAAQRVAERMLRPDLASGWGIRTLSSDHPAYNPFAYHLGSVWPVESWAFVEGCRGYGLDAEADAISTQLFEVAGHHRRLQLPEVLAGHARAAMPLPVSYPASQLPQAWSAGAAIGTLAALLGLRPDAPAARLTLRRPWLPAWAPVLLLRGLRIGTASVDLRLERTGTGAAAVEVLDTVGDLSVHVTED
jgi:glycogen debranching enzyme